MKISAPMLAFTLVSTSIHAGIFLVTDSINLTLPGSTGSVMSIKLEQNSPQPVTKSQQISKTVKRPPPSNAHQLSLLPDSTAPTVHIHSKKKQTLSYHKLSEENKVTVATNKNKAVSKAQVIAIVHKQLNNYFNYPLIAQKHNWQGKVIIEFTISRQGTIENIQIQQSSGFNILDQSAINSLKKIGQLPQLATWLNISMEIQLPVIYQLTEGY